MRRFERKEAWPEKRREKFLKNNTLFSQRKELHPFAFLTELKGIPKRGTSNIRIFPKLWNKSFRERFHAQRQPHFREKHRFSPTRLESPGSFAEKRGRFPAKVSTFFRKSARPFPLCKPSEVGSCGCFR